MTSRAASGDGRTLVYERAQERRRTLVTGFAGKRRGHMCGRRLADCRCAVVA